MYMKKKNATRISYRPVIDMNRAKKKCEWMKHFWRERLDREGVCCNTRPRNSNVVVEGDDGDKLWEKISKCYHM